MHSNSARAHSPLTSFISIAATVSLTLTTAIVATLAAAPAQAQGCVQVDWDPNSCSSGAINNGSVDVTGQSTNQGSDPGAGGGSGSSGSSSSGASGGSVSGSGGTDSVAPREPTFLEMCLRDTYFAAAVVECWDVISLWMQEQTAVTDSPAAPPTPRVITLSDLASFTPQGVTLSLQPGSWTVVGVETNFIAGAQVHVVGGSLLGRTVKVRFTPASFDWNYGDGSTRTTGDPGASWSALGV